MGGGHNGTWVGLWRMWLNGDGAQAGFKEVVRGVRALGAAELGERGCSTCFRQETVR